MGMVHAHGMLLCGDVVPEHQVELIELPAHPGDGRNRVVRRPVGLAEDEGRLVRVASPGLQDVIRGVRHLGRVLSLETDHGHGPAHHACRHIRISGQGEVSLIGSLRHGKHIISALEMVVAQDRAAHDGQIRVGPRRIVGELAHEIQKLHKGVLVDLHRDMLFIEDNAVLIVIYVGRILQEILLSVQADGDNPVVLPGRMAEMARVALVFPAQQAAGIAAFFRLARLRDVPGILLRLGQVDGDVDGAVLGVRHPFLILRDTVPADIVGRLAEGVVIVGGVLGRYLVLLPEAQLHLGGKRRQNAHDLRVKEVLRRDRVILQDLMLHRVIQHIVQDLVHRAFPRRRLLLLILVQPKESEQLVGQADLVRRIHQAVFHSIGNQLSNEGVDIFLIFHFSYTFLPDTPRDLITPSCRRTCGSGERCRLPRRRSDPSPSCTPPQPHV